MNAMRSRIASVIVLFGLLAGSPSIARPAPAPPASPSPAPSVTASASSSSSIVATGQIVDLERGYVVFSTGDAFKLAPDARVVDDATSQTPTYTVGAGVFAAITIDETSALVTDVRTSLRPLAARTPISEVPRAVVSIASTPVPNPDLVPPAILPPSRLSSDVLVTIDVEVPPETPYTDDVFITTDTSGWNAQAIKMQRLDGRRFRIQVHLKGGTEFRYLFTRGSWQSVERDRADLSRAPRTLFVPGGDSMVVSATVYRWADVQ